MNGATSLPIAVALECCDATRMCVFWSVLNARGSAEAQWRSWRGDLELRRMRMLITGNMGYVGPVLTRFLRENLVDAELIGFDTAYFAHSLTGAGLLPEAFLDRQVFGDIGSVKADQLCIHEI